MTVATVQYVGPQYEDLVKTRGGGISVSVRFKVGGDRWFEHVRSVSVTGGVLLGLHLARSKEWVWGDDPLEVQYFSLADVHCFNVVWTP